MKSGANSVASYSYDYVGNRDVTTLGNGTSTEYAYSTTDPRYLLNTITHKKGANTLATIDYTDTARDNAGNPKSMTDWTGTWDYSYDDNNRLISACRSQKVRRDTFSFRGMWRNLCFRSLQNHHCGGWHFGMRISVSKAGH